MAANQGLLYFRETPDEYGKDELMSSALQGFETSLINLSLGRYPHAFVTVAECFEKLLKLKFGSSKKFVHLIDEYCSEISAAQDLCGSMHNFRKHRNEIAHGGYSPEFNQRSLELYAPSGVYYVAKILEEYYCESFLGSEDHGYGLILPDLAEFIKFSRSTARIIMNKNPGQIAVAYYPLICKLRHSLSPNFVSDWELQCIEYGHSSGLFHDGVEGGWRDHGHIFSCPICAHQIGVHMDFYLEEDGSEVDELAKAHCYYCDFTISPSNVVYLGKLLDDEMDEYREQP
jgi:hypothetical protein